MRKLLIFVLTAALTLILWGCGGETAVSFPGSGTAEDPYRIETPAQLRQVAKLVNDKKTNKTYGTAHYLLTADIDLGGSALWKPIGTDAAPFGGVLDGGGHTVSGIRVRVADTASGAAGFVGELNKGAIRDLTVSDSQFYITAENSGKVAAIVGDVFRGTVENCHVTDTVTVEGTYHAAGICGNYQSDASLRGCTSAASVTVTGNVGSAAGIVVRSDGRIENCVNTGTIRSAGDGAGIASSANGGLADCINAGSITANNGYAAGIVCRFGDGALNHRENDDTVTLLRCINRGAVVSASDPAGGIAVRCSTGHLVDCVNEGSVTSPMETGGIFAYFNLSMFGAPCERFTVTGCVNSGAVTNSENASVYSVGGICGMIYDSGAEFVFENCVNSGEILSGEAAGGILGSGIAAQLFFAGCVNTGTVTGTGVCGGIAGEVNPYTGETEKARLFRAEDCRNEGTVYVKRDALNLGGTVLLDSYVGGIAGRYYHLPIEAPFDDVTVENCVNTGVLTGEEADTHFYAHDLCGTFAAPEA